MTDAELYAEYDVYIENVRYFEDQDEGKWGIYPQQYIGEESREVE